MDSINGVTATEIITAIKAFIPEVEDNNETLTISFANNNVYDNRTYTKKELPYSEIDTAIESIRIGTINGFAFKNGKRFEYAIRQSEYNVRPYFLDPSRLDILKTSVSDVQYEIQKPSATYILLLTYLLWKKGYSREYQLPRYIYADDAGFVDIIAKTLTVRSVVAITFEKERGIRWLSKAADAYRFNLSYNYNIVYVAEHFEPMHRPFSKRDIVGQLSPYKSYRDNLVRYYYQGVETRSPLMQYIAFYHVIEYFFQDISRDEIFQELQDQITSPSFLPTRKRDIETLWNSMRRITRKQNEAGVWNEKEALLRVIKRFIPELDKLRMAIIRLDDNSIEYMAHNMVPFVDADESEYVDFTKSSNDVYIAIQKRVYGVRNSIVHSKEGDKRRFIPFDDDKHLKKEVPLVKAVAELIIISNADDLEYDSN